jgi:hypothetical protein
VTPARKKIAVVSPNGSQFGGSTPSTLGQKRPLDSYTQPISVAKNLFSFDMNSDEDITLSEPDDPLLLEIWNATQLPSGRRKTSVDEGALTPPSTTIKPKVVVEKRSPPATATKSKHTVEIRYPLQSASKKKKKEKTLFHFESSESEEEMIVSKKTPKKFEEPVIKTSDISQLNKLHERTVSPNIVPNLHRIGSLKKLEIKKAAVNPTTSKSTFGIQASQIPFAVESAPVFGNEDVDQDWLREASPCLEDVTEDVDDGPRADSPQEKAHAPVLTISEQSEIKMSMLSFLSNCRVE